MISYLRKGIKRVRQEVNIVYVLLFNLLMFGPSVLFAKNPWTGDSSLDPTDLQETSTQYIIQGLRLISIVAGVFLIIFSVKSIWTTLARDADERKDHGSSVMTILIAVVCVVVGMLMLGFAWDATDTDLN